MADKLTPQQQEAVNNRGGKLLVSAAAGSGKTKVLVDRLMAYLTDPVDPANLDDFLIITYTKAAASELRGKIASKLSERIAMEPENRHLQQQMQRLYLAKISTVHAFCTDLLRQYAYMLDIAPDFRVGDENECVALRQMAMESVLDSAYKNASEDPYFRAFVDTQGLGRDDRLVPQIVEKAYNSAQCHMDSDAWLDQCVKNADVSQITDAGKTIWGEYLMQDLVTYVQLQIDALDRCRAAADETAEFAKVSALLSDTVYQLRQLRDCKTWDEVIAHKQVDFGRLTFPRKHDNPELAERIKTVRDHCKEGLEKKLRSFSDPTGQITEDLQQAGDAIRGIVRLVRSFASEYARLKRRRRLLDFGDLEHRTLDLLLGKSRSGQTKIAREISKRFREVLVDEYQDSNAVQDAIFSALTLKKNNCFMVGDVKQSIYMFRLADPEIFLDKYRRYMPAEFAEPGQGRKVLLSSNFRSGGAVLSAVNDVFRLCMSPKVGGLVYNDEEMLKEGIPHIPLEEPEVELHAIFAQEDTYAEESAYVAQRIAQLLDGKHMVRQGDTLRPIVPEDIVILLRSPGSVGRQFAAALEKRGIACTTGGGQDLLKTAEIITLRSLLQTISNPRQDIPLISALASPLFGFTADDLAVLRSKNRRGCVYDALLQDDRDKSVWFVETLDRLRHAARMCSLSQLLEHVFALTHMDSIYAAMPDGNRRAENLQTFFKLAVDFESSGRRELNQFLEHLDAMEEKGLVSAGEKGNAGSVTIMSIHRSKGLEFPVVILSGLGRKFNREDLKAQVLCDRELGLGLSSVDQNNRVSYPTIAKRAIAAKIGSDSLSEELRVLYVAMTRARDRLIMTYADQHLEGTVGDIAGRMDFSPGELLTGDVKCPGEWVLQAALRRTEAGDLFALGFRPKETTVSDTPWRIEVNTVVPEDQKLTRETVRQQMPEGVARKMAASLAFTYPFEAATKTPSKQTATQRKNREKDEEAAQNTDETLRANRNWRKPSFREVQKQGKAYGNAYHGVMRYIRYASCSDVDAVRQELERMVSHKLIPAEDAEIVDCSKIAAFFQTDLGRKLMTGKQVLREFKFSILDDAKRYGDGLDGEQVLLQGVVDCALIEPDGITVVDFKTDRVSEDTVSTVADRYRAQVETYSDALSRIYQCKVKEKLLYFFQLGRFISL